MFVTRQVLTVVMKSHRNKVNVIETNLVGGGPRNGNCRAGMSLLQDSQASRSDSPRAGNASVVCRHSGGRQKAVQRAQVGSCGS